MLDDSPERKHFDRLTDFVQYAYEQQSGERDRHGDLIRHIEGEFYPRPPGAMGNIETTINLLSMASRAYARQLISKAPRMLVTAGPPDLQSWAEDVENDVNRRIIESDLGLELAECAGQSLTSYGIFFMGPVYAGTPTSMKLEIETKAIALENFVHDPDCARLEQASLVGHKFEIPVVDVHENPMFAEDVRRQVDADARESSTTPDESEEKRLRGISHRTLRDVVTLWCVFDRLQNRIYYYPRHQPNLLLHESEWLGPKHGPYRFLYFEKPTNKCVPIAPLGHLLKKHKAFNHLDAKAIHQQQKSKSILSYTNAQEQAARQVIQSVDNEAILEENGPLRWITYGGASPDTVAMKDMQRNEFSYAAGNLDQLAGLATQAPTLGQERLLAGAAHGQAGDMQETTELFVQGIGEDMFFYSLRDPNPQPVFLKKSIPGTGLSYERPWTREHREFARQLRLDVTVEPYSYVIRSPGERLADVLGALQLVMGMGDMMAAQGISVDVEAVVRTVAKMRNLPELYDMLILNQDPEELSRLLTIGGPKDQPNEIPSGPKRYIRESQSDGAGQEIEMQRMFGRAQASREQVA